MFTQTPRKDALAALIALSLSGMPAFATEATNQDRDEHTQAAASTGSRIQIPGGSPVAPLRVIERDEIDASGAVSTAEFLRGITLAVFGNRKPNALSNRGSVSDINLLGLGSHRTLVLLDGRPFSFSPFVDSSVDLNLIPIGAIERIEILPEGASAIHGSNAIGGVVNLITRKQYAGARMSTTLGNPSVRGGDTEQGEATYGASGERGNVTATVSFNQRDVVYARDQVGGDVLTPFLQGNNYQVATASGSSGNGPIRPMPGFDCSAGGSDFGSPNGLFYLVNLSPDNQACLYNANGIVANEASADTSGLQVAAEFRINGDWSTYLQALVSRNESFGRLAPSAMSVFVAENSWNDPVPGDGRGAFVHHRFAAVGPRDLTVDENARDLRLGFKGRIRDAVDVDFGARIHGAQAYRLGRNFIVEDLAAASVAQGTYDVRQTSGNDASVLDSISATISRDARWEGRELFATTAFDALTMPGGISRVFVGAEWQDHDFSSLSDPLQASGAILEAHGTSRRGERSIRSLHGEWLLPIAGSLDVTAAGWLAHYSDLGTEFAPKVAAQWRISPRWTIHGSYGRSFAASPLSLNGESVSACDFLPIANCGNIEFGRMGMEQSDHARIGFSFDHDGILEVSGSVYGIRIDHPVAQDSDFDLGTALPPGLSVVRDPVTGEIIIQTRERETTSGADLSVLGHAEIGAWGKLSSGLRLTHVARMEVVSGFGSVSAPLVDDFAGTHTFPDLRATMSHDWALGDLGVSWRSDYIEGTPGGLYLTNIGGYTTHHLQVRWNTPWNGRITIGATNLGNKQPTLDPSMFSGLPWNFALYDGYGRTPYLRYTQWF